MEELTNSGDVREGLQIWFEVKCNEIFKQGRCMSEMVHRSILQQERFNYDK